MVIKNMLALAVCCALFFPVLAEEPAGEPPAQPERIDIEMPLLINSSGSGRYPSSRPNTHIPFGVYWTEAKPADYIWLFPSMLGGTVFIAAGNVIGWPFKAGWNAFHGDFEGEAMVPPLDWSAKYFGIPGSYIVGGPFWVLKKSFVDFPVWLFGGDKKDEDAADYNDYDY